MVDDAVRLGYPVSTPGFVYWTERRAGEGGRQVVVAVAAAPPGAGPQDGSGRPAAMDVLDPPFAARTLVHEYGGVPYTVFPETGDAGHAAGAADVVYFSNAADQRLYRTSRGRQPVPITPEPPRPRSIRYASPVLTHDGSQLLCVRERHPDPDLASHVVNDVVAVSTSTSPASATSEPRVMAAGHDFFSHVRISPDGKRVCWIAWDHPNMPWDASELWEAELGAGVATEPSRGTPRRVAGGPGEWVTQPSYDPTGRLLFLSDRTGWSNLFAAAPDGDAVPLAPMEADIGVPDWEIGTSSYAVLADGTVVAAWSERGVGRLGLLQPGASSFQLVPTGLTTFAWLRTAADGRSVVAVAGSACEPPAVVLVDVPTGGNADDVAVRVLARSRERVVGAEWLSLPEPVEVPVGGDRTVYALHYPPRNPAYRSSDGELPPLVVRSHSGPTASASTLLDYGTQFWTSRGYAVMDVDYGGSAGHGRAYREELRGRWGVVDVDDCVAAARYLAEIGRADPGRLLIRGSSAGGFTALCALTFRDVFRAGASLYGISDVAALSRETHKFELHYNDGLVAPWPETASVYRERSPLFHAERMRAPVIVFQGADDPVVPPSQAEAIVAALRRNGVPHAYVVYEGEGHGFRRAENLRRTAEAELYFYGRVLGVSPADDLDPVEIVLVERLGIPDPPR